MLLQEYRFDIRFIPGKNNIVADALSRLCLNRTEEFTTASDGGGISEPDISTVFPDERLAAIFELNEDDRRDAALTSTEGTFHYMETLHQQGYKFIDNHISQKQVQLEETVDEMFAQMTLLEKDVVIADDETPFPEELYNTIKSTHNHMAGHHGVNSTIRKLKENGIRFKYMRRWVDKFIKLCPGCNKSEERSFPIAIIPYTLASYQAMQRLQLDSIGPLREDELGNKFILVVIDTFTRWVMLYPLPSTSANDCVRAIIQHIGIFGSPNEVCTDGGSQFENETVKPALLLMNTLHNIGIAYSSEEQGIVERENKEVLRHLRNFLFDKRQGFEWSLAVPFVQRILNAEVVSSIGYKPSQLIFGNAINLDRGIFLPNKIIECAHTHDFPKYIDRLIIAQKESLEGARLRQRASDLRHMTERSVGEETEFAVGSLVLLEYSKGLNGKKPPHKLMTRLGGPYVVRSHEGPKYRLRHLANKHIQEVHVSRLRPFRYDPKRTDPNAVAAADIDEFLVANVIDHRPKTKGAKRSDMEFLVQWDGYDASHDSWEPWETLRNNSIIHDYCLSHNMKRFVPKNIQQSDSSEDEV